MAVSTADSLECAICNDNLLDPRPLPCGHSYCGPPRPCLASLENGNCGLRCAVCRTDHKLNADEIKPLYGIRDYIQEISKKQVDDSSRLPCTAHPNKDFTLWCSNCNVMICDDCIEELHDDHSVRKLKKFLESKIERELGKPFHEGISECRKCLEEMIESRLSVLEHSKLEVESMEKNLQSLLHQKDLLDQYCKLLENNSCNIPSEETNLMINILESGLLNAKYSQSTEKCEQKRCKQVKVSKSTQTCDMSFQSSFHTASNVIASSTQTAFSRYRAMVAQEDNDVCCLASTYISNQTSNIKLSTANEAGSVTQLEVCSCGYKHELNAPWNAPVYIFLLLHVIERKPLRIGPSSEIASCPFQFIVETELVPASCRSDKVLRIILRCLHAFRKHLPSTTLKYKIWLRNLESSDRNKTTEGIWLNPQSDEISFDAIRYSELVNPKEKWIQTKQGDDCLEIALQLMRLS